jgi:hypothetical protein
MCVKVFFIVRAYGLISSSLNYIGGITLSI